MNKLENLAGRVRGLTSEELKTFREWFVAFDADAWELEFQADVQNGKFDELAARALRDHKAGRATEL